MRDETSRRSGTRHLLTVGLIVLAGSCFPALADEPELLTRSFYVPVSLNLCEHFEDVILFRDEAPLRELPGTQVFQFTFYPNLKRIEPAMERVRIQGLKRGEPFRAEVIVTPASVYIGKKKIDLDLDEQMSRLREHVDARHEPVELSLKCENSCGRRVASSSTRSSSR